MNESDLRDDERFDALLRELGPEIPCPGLDAGARARLDAVISGRGARTGGRSVWRAAAVIGLVGGLVIACAVLGVGLVRTEDELAVSRAQTDEAIELFVRARLDDPTVAVPEDLAGVRAEDLVLIAFHHDLCPISRHSTPGFEALAAGHAGEGARFMTLDVTGAGRDKVGGEIEGLGMGYALLAPIGAETGVVKVLDTRRGLLLSSAPGRRGLEQARTLLARVGGLDAAP